MSTYRQGSIRMVFVIAFLTAGIAGSFGLTPTAAQSSGIYTSQVTGAQINATGSWTYMDDLTEVTDGYEFVGMQDASSISAIAFFPGNTNLEAARDAFLDGFASEQELIPVDRGAYGQVSYSLDLSSIDGIEVGIFSVFQSSLLEGYAVLSVYMAPISYFASGMTSAQSSITLNTTPLFEGIDPSGLQDMLEPNAGVTGGQTEVGQQDVPADEPGSTVESDDDVLADSGTYLDDVRTEVDSLYIGVGDFLIAFTSVTEGGLSDSELTSTIDQMHDIATGWQTYPQTAAGFVAPSGYEEIDAAYQDLATDVGSLGDSWYAFLGDTSSTTALDNILADLEVVLDGLDDVQVLLDNAGGGSETVTEPTEEPVIDEPTEAPTEEASESERSSSGGNRRLPDRSDETGIEEDIQNESETGQGSDGANLSDYVELGLISDTEYVSPQHDVEIVWDDNWYFDSSTDNPISSDSSEGIDSVSITWTGESYVVVYVDIFESDGFLPDEYVEYWTSDEYMSTSTAPDAEILLDDSSDSGGAVLYREYLDDGTEISMLMEVTCLDRRCDLIAYTTMIGLPDTFGDAYADAEDGIVIEGDSLFTIFNTRQIDRAID